MISHRTAPTHCVIAAVAGLALGACLVPPRDRTVGGVHDGGGVDRGPDERADGGYQYPGCPDQDYGCPRLITFYCAMDALRLAHATCASDEDCAFATLDLRCTGWDACTPAAVTVTQRASYEAAADAEGARYCASNGGCAESPECALPRSAFRPACRGGLCAAVLGPCTAHAECGPGFFCAWDVDSCGPGSERTVLRAPGECRPIACGATSCEGMPCQTSEDCAPAEACGLQPDVCAHGGECTAIVTCDPDCEPRRRPHTYCDVCVCPAC
jgi:hypothetical protein